MKLKAVTDDDKEDKVGVRRKRKKRWGTVIVIEIECYF